jgi:hypothetical protein
LIVFDQIVKNLPFGLYFQIVFKQPVFRKKHFFLPRPSQILKKNLRHRIVNDELVNAGFAEPFDFFFGRKPARRPFFEDLGCFWRF